MPESDISQHRHRLRRSAGLSTVPDIAADQKPEEPKLYDIWTRTQGLLRKFVYKNKLLQTAVSEEPAEVSKGWIDVDDKLYRVDYNSENQRLEAVPENSLAG